ncbi:hypothetical protein [Gluconacetobacter tumulicola]|uniref:Uncharacterized protein n=1 Tax=Gluconacetobacter tumulicola TaxID=1017177 RepID=A0A7W4P9L5_9PROT|nr:hypothetical protein [Gluconacetobacter tumulicola]MBB2180583.1 hypothetical protein [Gluconacetobacter tumulicola]
MTVRTVETVKEDGFTFIIHSQVIDHHIGQCDQPCKHLPVVGIAEKGGARIRRMGDDFFPFPMIRLHVEMDGAFSDKEEAVLQIFKEFVYKYNLIFRIENAYSDIYFIVNHFHC